MSPLSSPATEILPDTVSPDAYRIAAAINRVRAATDTAEAAEAELRGLEESLPAGLREQLERDPDLVHFICQPNILSLNRRLSRVLHALERFGQTVLPGRLTEPPARRPNAAPDIFERDPGRTSGPARMYVDVTAAHHDLVGGGLKRVSLCLARAFNRSGDAQPCVKVGDKLCALTAAGVVGEPIRMRPSDTYLVLDSFWDEYDKLKRILMAAKQHGVKTVVCIHDVIPILNRGLIVDEWADWFRDCFVELLPYIDRFVSVSRSSAEEITVAAKRVGADKPTAWFHLGSDTFGSNAHGSDPFGTQRFSARIATPSFVSVGTLEPKKGYECALDAFEVVWARDLDVSYTIVGKRGWLCRPLIARIEGHPDFGRRLFWVEDASDDKVREIFNASYCLVQASLAEGFGLPIVEAAAAGLPVIASDIPIFREICVENVRFFPVCDAYALADAIDEAAKQRPAPARTVQLTWDQSAKGLIRAATS